MIIQIWRVTNRVSRMVIQWYANKNSDLVNLIKLILINQSYVNKKTLAYRNAFLHVPKCVRKTINGLQKQLQKAFLLESPFRKHASFLRNAHRDIFIATITHIHALINFWPKSELNLMKMHLSQDWYLRKYNTIRKETIYIHKATYKPSNSVSFTSQLTVFCYY